MKKGFTLIELIIVIAILAILAAIAYPALMAMRERPLLTAANKAATDLAQGIGTFKSDHNGLLPIKGNRLKEDKHDQYNLITQKGEDASLVQILTNREDKNSDDIVNSSQEIYMRSDVQDSPRDGLFVEKNGKVSLYDPWGQPYYIVLTYNDAEGCIDPFTEKSTGKPTIIFSKGPDMEGVPDNFTSSAGTSRSSSSRSSRRKSAQRDDEYNEQLRDNIYSWKKLKD